MKDVAPSSPSSRAALARDRRWLRQKIAGLVANQPLTAAFELELAERTTARRVWYRSQKEHWLGWLGEYEGRGAYGRKNWNRSAQFIYNHIGCPAMLVWLVEASGLPRKQVSSAIAEALRTRSNFAAQCAVLRHTVPWQDVEGHLRRTAYKRA
jgi:hypothetical protein